MHSSTLHAEIIASFNNPLFDPDHSLIEEVLSNQAQHNIYPPTTLSSFYTLRTSIT